MRVIIIFIGPAGAGKSTLVAAYARWLSKFEGIRVFKVNLDPAADYIPYEPDFDVRSVVSTREIALKYRLGPNGALVKSIELITKKLKSIVSKFCVTEADFILVDTPGQMKVFVFRDIAPMLISLLKESKSRVIAVFAIDASVVRNPEDYAFIAIMSTALQARLGIDVVPVMNKTDLARNAALVGDVVSDAEHIIKLLQKRGVYGEMMAEVLKVIWSYAKATTVPKVSAIAMEGISQLHRLIHEVTCSCGDLT